MPKIIRVRGAMAMNSAGEWHITDLTAEFLPVSATLLH